MRQLNAYHKAVAKYKNIYKYMIFVDCDEFLFCKDMSIFLLLMVCLSRNKMGGIAVNWMIFGSSGFLKHPTGDVLTSYLYRANDDFEANHYVKSICNHRTILGFSNPHAPFYKKR